MRILIVEDEPTLAQQLLQAIAAAGYAPDHAPNGQHADFLASTESYDAILLDLGLPQIDGLSLLRQWRANSLTTPILILTARGSWHEKVQGIDAGADDYLAKPFQLEELLARLRALIRRASGHAQSQIALGPISLDTRSAQVTAHGLPVKLTALEFRTLSYLMHHHSRIVTRTELIDHIYSQDFDRDSNTIEVFIARLRRKLGPDSILTIRGIGYRMRPPQS